MKKQEKLSENFRSAIQKFSSFPGFLAPIAIFALAAGRRSTLIFLAALAALAALHLAIKLAVPVSRPQFSRDRSLQNYKNFFQKIPRAPDFSQIFPANFSAQKPPKFCAPRFSLKKFLKKISQFFPTNFSAPRFFSSFHAGISRRNFQTFLKNISQKISIFFTTIFSPSHSFHGAPRNLPSQKSSQKSSQNFSTRARKFLARLRVRVDSASFPSNHSAGALLLFFFAQKKLSQISRQLSALFGIFAILVALARLRARRHRVRDLLGALITSSLIFQLTRQLF